jgi:lipopolysaccharide transport protein LptA
VFIFNGNVVVTKGTMIIRAQRIEVRESPDGYRSAVAIGSAVAARDLPAESATRPTNGSRATPSGSSTTAAPT